MCRCFVCSVKAMLIRSTSYLLYVSGLASAAFTALFSVFILTAPNTLAASSIITPSCGTAAMVDTMLNESARLSGVPNPPLPNGLTPEGLRGSSLEICLLYLKGFVQGQRIAFGEQFAYYCSFIDEYGAGLYSSLLVESGFSLPLARVQGMLTSFACILDEKI